MGNKATEVNYKKDFCIKYFDKGTWDLDVLTGVDVFLKSNKGKPLLYIETKDVIRNETDRRKALAQTILTNRKQKHKLSKVALVYRDEDDNDYLELLDCGENSILWNTDINWEKERASMPSDDAVERINDRLKGHIQVFKNEQIKEIYRQLKAGKQTAINITEKNFNVVFNDWKNTITFIEEIPNEQDLINLFLADLLNNTKYRGFIKKDKIEKDLFSDIGVEGIVENTEQDLIREGTNLNRYEIIEKNDQVFGIVYLSDKQSLLYRVKNAQAYHDFWMEYKRPPEREEFLKILERSATLYTEKYRRTVGGEYTPSCFVKKQVEILTQHYDMNDYIVFDPCAGVGNLENEFGKDYKEQCYLSTLEQMDVDICKIKDFGNSIRFDYLKDESQPTFAYHGYELTVDEICKRENKKLMVIMNPPYQRQAGRANNLAIEFFNKVLKLDPQVIVFYYTTESFFRDEIQNYINSGYKIVSHIFSSAKTTFKLSDWSISQVIFDKNEGESISRDIIKADRYEVKKRDFKYIKTYTYDNSKPDLLGLIEQKIKENNTGEILGEWNWLSNVLGLKNEMKQTSNIITTGNLKYCLLLKGLNFNAHGKYFERNRTVHRGQLEDISDELFSDSIMFSLFYVKNAFSNKNKRVNGEKIPNYIMPFTAEELGCNKNELNILLVTNNNLLFPREGNFDFREFLKQFKFSEEAKNLYKKALAVFLYYHDSKEYSDKNWNDSFYDITNAIMKKNPKTDFTEEGANSLLEKHKSVKGTQGFGKTNIKFRVSNKKDTLIFDDFFFAREALAKKINKELLDKGLLLWERDNLF